MLITYRAKTFNRGDVVNIHRETVLGETVTKSGMVLWAAPPGYFVTVCIVLLETGTLETMHLSDHDEIVARLPKRE
jgi:hypothetical protein